MTKNSVTIKISLQRVSSSLTTHYNCLWQCVSQLMRLKSQKSQKILQSVQEFENWLKECSFCPQREEIPQLYRESCEFFQKSLSSLRIVGFYND